MMTAHDALCPVTCFVKDWAQNQLILRDLGSYVFSEGSASDGRKA